MLLAEGVKWPKCFIALVQQNNHELNPAEAGATMSAPAVLPTAAGRDPNEGLWRRSSIQII